ncbi:ATP-binding cassette domain-containing protein [Egicoccus sp. AB-alg6-2]|uniref:ATP-binding cassette domain-containing protein n=1 Tax=Egicoccus sp. AB-alg6-2 TaxID=3242692 RepID=UPI00359EA2F3
MTAPSATTRAAERRATWRVVRHMMGVRKGAYWGGGALWWLFILAPLAVGVVLERLFDALGDGGPALLLLAAVTGIEVTRALSLPLVGWLFEPFWGHTETVLRTNVLRAQLHPDPERRGPAITDAAAAMPLFRDDPEHVARATDYWLTLVATGGIAMVALAVIARIDVLVAVAVAVPLLLASCGGYLIAPMVRRRRADDRAVTGEVTGFMGEVFGAVTTVTTSGAAPALLRHLARLCERRRVTAVRDRVAGQLLPAVGEAAGDLALAAGLLAAALVVGDELTAGQVALLAAYAHLLAGVPRHWAGWLTVRRHADVSVDRLRGAVADRDVEALIAPIGPVPLAPPPVERHPLPPSPSAPRLQLVGLVTCAPDGQVLGPFDLDVPAGGFAVVTGRVGTGKSTLVRAVLGLAPQLAGEIRWDGVRVDASRWMTPPRAAYVAQVPTLFSETLDDNLRLGWDLGEDDLQRALDAAAARDLVAELEHGLRTRLGPRGIRLSGGQAHRVAAARALVAGSALVVADDLSAALDAETEAALLDRILGDRARTMLVVSHRPSVLERADVVLELGT